MRWESLLFAAVLGVAGCASRPEGHGISEQPASTVIVTPATGNRGRIISANLTARHVVVTYPIGIPLPVVDQQLYVYRAGLKVAELRVSKERIDVNLIADITSGECRVGDEVRPD